MTKEELGEIKTVKVYNQAYVDKQQKRITELEKENAELKKESNQLFLEGAKRVEELEAQIEEMKKELHHILVSPSKNNSDCLDKIVGLDRLWKFGEEF